MSVYSPAKQNTSCRQLPSRECPVRGLRDSRGWGRALHQAVPLVLLQGSRPAGFLAIPTQLIIVARHWGVHLPTHGLWFTQKVVYQKIYKFSLISKMLVKAKTMRENLNNTESENSGSRMLLFNYTFDYKQGLENIQPIKNLPIGLFLWFSDGEKGEVERRRGPPGRDRHFPFLSTLALNPQQDPQGPGIPTKKYKACGQPSCIFFF